MRCNLLDVGCYVLAWFWDLPWWVHWGLVALAALALWGVVARVWSFAKGFGGWQAAVAAVENRYDLVLIGARRARELGRGDKPKLDGPKHSTVVTALKEIEHGKVGREYLYKQLDIEPRRRYKDYESR